jgi:Integrase core domain
MAAGHAGLQLSFGSTGDCQLTGQSVSLVRLSDWPVEQGLSGPEGRTNLRLAGRCFDNAAMETFWATLKREIAHIRGPEGIWFETRDAARSFLFEFIEVFYNRQRHQAGLGHLTPAEYAARLRERL